MSVELKLFLAICLGCVSVWVIKKLIFCFYNLQTLIKAKKNPQDYPRTSGSIVFNKKTKKLEETGGKTILPF